MGKKTIKRTVKASVFEDIFSDRNNLLMLYKVLHPEDTKVTEEDLQNVSIKNILSNGQYNDLGFRVRDKLIILVEHQSTWSVNILPRTIMYLAESWHRYFQDNKIDLYNSARVYLPEPELYVLYTGGKTDIPSEITLEKEFFAGKKVAINATMKVLKYKGGTDIVDQYIVFCKVADQKIKKYGVSEKALIEAVQTCVKKGILVEYLNGREQEVVNIMMSLFSQEEVNEIREANSFKRGIAEGRTEGIAIGKSEGSKLKTVELCKRFGKGLDETINIVKDDYQMSDDEAKKYVEKHWCL